MLTVIEHARAKYRCEKDGESTIRTAAAEPSPLPKSNAGAGLLAHVLVSKYQDHLPLNRQERMFGRHSVALSKTTLCDWTLGAAELLERLIAPLTAHVLAAAVVGADDTTLQLAQSGDGAGSGVRRGRTRTARLWAYQCGGFKLDPGGGWAAHAPAVMFDFTESREGLHPLRILARYAGYLQADAYAGFDALFRAGWIIEVACWAHARRKFFEVAKSQSTPGLAHEAVRFIAALYAVESEIKGQTPAERLNVRQLRSVPLLANFKVWLDAHGPNLLPKSPLGNAFSYALANWTALCRFTECGILEPDNNAVERAIRPIALGRNNAKCAFMRSLSDGPRVSARRPWQAWRQRGSGLCIRTCVSCGSNPTSGDHHGCIRFHSPVASAVAARQRLGAVRAGLLAPLDRAAIRPEYCARISLRRRALRFVVATSPT